MMIKTFDETSTTNDVLSGIKLTGKRILITGVSAGIGVETARSLAAHGAKVVGAVRNLDKAANATECVWNDAREGGGFRLVELDLASLKSVRKCADELLATGEEFDVVIANAGIMACPKQLTEDGFEMQFGTNHLGHFVLINRILPLFKKDSRLVNLSSAGHRFADVDIEDPNFEQTEYTEFGAYGRSKTANILFAVEFDRRHKDKGIRATAVHPGVIRTELTRHMSADALDKIMEDIRRNQAAGAPALQFKTIEQGAATTVWAAVAAKADSVGGNYCEDCHVAEISDAGPDVTIRGGVRRYAIDADHARALWAKSEEMVGERF